MLKDSATRYHPFTFFVIGRDADYMAFAPKPHQPRHKGKIIMVMIKLQFSPGLALSSKDSS